jgi:hypothetical protein
MILIRASDITKRQGVSEIFLYYSEICSGGSVATVAPAPDDECFYSEAPFIAVALEGEWLGWKIYNDNGRLGEATIIGVSGSPMANCYLIEGNGAHSWRWSA